MNKHYHLKEVTLGERKHGLKSRLQVFVITENVAIGKVYSQRDFSAVVGGTSSIWDKLIRGSMMTSYFPGYK